MYKVIVSVSFSVSNKTHKKSNNFLVFVVVFFILENLLVINSFEKMQHKGKLVSPLWNTVLWSGIGSKEELVKRNWIGSKRDNVARNSL